MQKESNFLSFQCDRTCQCYVFLSGTPRYMIHHTDLSNWVTFIQIIKFGLEIGILIDEVSDQSFYA